MNSREILMARDLSEEQVALIIIAMEQVNDLIGDSRGVAGLHLNGDEAEWDWVFDHWLDTFAEAYEPIRLLHDKRMAELERAKNTAFEATLKEKDAHHVG